MAAFVVAEHAACAEEHDGERREGTQKARERLSFGRGDEDLSRQERAGQRGHPQCDERPALVRAVGVAVPELLGGERRGDR